MGEGGTERRGGRGGDEETEEREKKMWGEGGDGSGVDGRGLGKDVNGERRDQCAFAQRNDRIRELLPELKPQLAHLACLAW